MMFSSNQIFEISGSLWYSNQLENALEFALKYSGHDHLMSQKAIDSGYKLLYQITEDGNYCIGWPCQPVPDGWLEYPFKFEIPTVSQIIRQHLEKYPVPDDPDYGSYEKGFIMKCINVSSESEKEGIKNTPYGIVYFKPFRCFYAR